MRHRHLSNSFTRFGIDQQDNNHTPVEHSYFPTGRAENGPFVGQNQMNHMSRGHRSLEGGSSRANEYPPPPSNISMEVQPPFSHPSITENRCFPPGGHYTNYNHLPNTHDMESGPLNHHHHHHPTPNGGGGGPLKRKRSGSLNSLYTVGSSSSSSASQMPIEKPTLDPYRGNLTIDGQDSSRNVRRRYRHDDMESESSTSITRSHVPNHFYQSPPVPVPPPPPTAPHVPHYPAPSQSHIREMSGGSRHEMNQFHVGGSSGDPVFSRQNLHVHRRIQSSYGSGSRYSHSHYGTSSSTNGNGNGLRTPPESFSPRNSRHWSPGGNGWRGNYSHRSGRPRIAVERFHSVVDVTVTESHDRIGHETLMMVDRGASLYGNSRNFSDQYRDLRLDIDNMSYEELLNLEERIGSVNTGLSEDSISKCLREKVYYSTSDQNHEEVSCPICLWNTTGRV